MLKLLFVDRFELNNKTNDIASTTTACEAHHTEHVSQTSCSKDSLRLLNTHDYLIF